jgi:hypothetical protein
MKKSEYYDERKFEYEGESTKYVLEVQAKHLEAIFGFCLVVIVMLTRTLSKGRSRNP